MLKLIGIPFDANSSYKRGSALAPKKMRLMDEEGSANKFCEFGTAIIEGENYMDCGDIYFENEDEYFLQLGEEVTVFKIREDGNFSFSDKKWIGSKKTVKMIGS